MTLQRYPAALASIIHHERFCEVMKLSNPAFASSLLSNKYLQTELGKVIAERCGLELQFENGACEEADLEKNQIAVTISGFTPAQLQELSRSLVIYCLAEKILSNVSGKELRDIAAWANISCFVNLLGSSKAPELGGVFDTWTGTAESLPACAEYVEAILMGALPRNLHAFHCLQYSAKDAPQRLETCQSGTLLSAAEYVLGCLRLKEAS